MISTGKYEKPLRRYRTALGTKGEVVVATAHCTPVETFTEFKPRIKQFSPR